MRRTLKAPTGRPDREDFARYVAALPPSDFKLGLTHVTTGYFLRDILDAKKIAPAGPCPVLMQPLVYAFYGRPAYRNTTRDNMPSDLPYVFPAVLLLDPVKAPAPKYVFGFDTGAFVSGRMNDYVDPYMPLFDFHLEPDVQSAARLAKAFFGSPRDFLDNKPTPEVAIPLGEFEAFSYSKMVASNGRGTNRLDDRVSTPELIFDEIPIEDCVVAAILPDALAGDPNLRERIENLGVKIKDYEWSGASRPIEYHRQIRQMAYAIFEDLGWL